MAGSMPRRNAVGGPSAAPRRIAPWIIDGPGSRRPRDSKGRRVLELRRCASLAERPGRRMGGCLAVLWDKLGTATALPGQVGLKPSSRDWNAPAPELWDVSPPPRRAAAPSAHLRPFSRPRTDPNARLTDSAFTCSPHNRGLFTKPVHWAAAQQRTS